MCECFKHRKHSWWVSALLWTGHSWNFTFNSKINVNLTDDLLFVILLIELLTTNNVTASKIKRTSNPCNCFNMYTHTHTQAHIILSFKHANAYGQVLLFVTNNSYISVVYNHKGQKKVQCYSWIYKGSRVGDISLWK
jgi:hypothetical protein